MRWTRTPDFRKRTKKPNPYDAFYDLDFDAVLIEQSIAKQYHILPSQQGDLSYCDWAKLVSGLMNDTPLGKVVELRSETDKEILKNMTAEQRAARQKWFDFCNSSQRISEEDMQKQSEALEKMIAAMFG